MVFRLPPMLSKHNKLSTSFESLSVEVRMDCSGKPLPTMKGDIKQEVSDTSYDNNDNPLESSADIDMRSNTNFILTYNPKVRQDQRVSLRPVGSNAQTESGVVGQIFLITEVLFSYMCSFVQLIRININLLCLLNILHEKLDKKLQKTEIRRLWQNALETT